MASQSNFSSSITSPSSLVNSSRYDKMKVFEVSIINLVELSALAAEQNRMELALEKGREALEELNLLKAFMMQEKNTTTGTLTKNNNNNISNNQWQQVQPMTTGVRLFELLLMVNSNLAAQLKNNGLLNEALELYTELCKMATTNSNIANSNSIISLNTQQYDGRLLLYRFGLNIGNVLYQMRDYSRALKYYRLTLDRLAASSGQSNLRMKLMNNIAITQMAMANQLDAIKTLNLLLADNLSQQQQQQEQSIARSEHRPQVVSQNVTTVCNSNHHTFALNLMVCLHQQQQQQSQLDVNSSIESTLKSLVKVDICQQYERVFDLDLNHNSTDSSAFTAGGSSSTYAQEPRNRSRAAESRATTASGRRHRRGSGGRALRSQQITTETTNPDTDIVDRDEIDDEATLSTWTTATAVTATETHSTLPLTNRSTTTTATNETTGTGSSHNTDNIKGESCEQQQQQFLLTVGQSGQQTNLLVSTAASAAEKSRQVMSAIKEDRLETLIDRKHREICRVFIMASNLLLLNYSTTTTANGANQSSNHYKRNSTVTNGKRTSAFHYCLNLFATSETYKSLLCDLKTNKLNEMLSKRFCLAKAKALLEQIETEQEQQVEVNSTQQNAMHKSAIFMSSSRAPKKHMILKSYFKNATLCFIHTLKGNVDKAANYGKFALEMRDNTDTQTLLNLAICQYLQNDLDKAQSLNNRAFLLDCNRLEALHNALLFHRRSNSSYDVLEPSLRTAVSKTTTVLAKRHNTANMILPQVQLAMLYYQSSQAQQALNVLKEFLSNSRQSPEVYLLFCKAQESLKGSQPSECLTILQQANQEHPFSIPILERLIAYRIQVFDYEKAEMLLLDCIKLRPDQPRWFKMLAECYIQTTDYSRAIDIYKCAMVRFPHDTSCIKSLLKLYAELGLEEELKTLEERSSKLFRQRGIR